MKLFTKKIKVCHAGTTNPGQKSDGEREKGRSVWRDHPDRSEWTTAGLNRPSA